MEKKTLCALLEAFDHLKIAVIGDFFLDKLLYINRDWDEPSVETGLTAYQVESKKCCPGSAGTVSSNLGALGIGTRYSIGITGNDGEGFDLEKALRENGCCTQYMVAEEGRFTPTYMKTFFQWPDGLEETYRVDTKNRKRMSSQTEQQLIHGLRELEGQVDAFICLEQLKDSDNGVFTQPIISELERISLGGLSKVFADSRFNIAKFRHMIVKCNDNEILHMAGIDAELDGAFTPERMALVESAMRMLQEKSGFPVIVTCGSKGSMVLSDGKLVLVPAYRVKGPIDVCGAGDAALAGLVSAVCAGADLRQAALVGNLVASLIVEQIGVTGVATREQVLRRFDEYEAMEKE